MVDLGRHKEEVEVLERNHVHREKSNGVWITAMPHLLNVTELSRGNYTIISA